MTNSRELQTLDQVFLRLQQTLQGHELVIACLYTAEKPLRYAVAMSRRPSPPVGAALDEGLAEMWHEAIAINPAIHDGALAIGRQNRLEAYRIRGWSYRLFPPPISLETESNRGSAYNSCIAMSAVTEVDAVY